jgi:hypothetical protein
MPGGRPLKFTSVEELEEKINQYFEDEEGPAYESVFIDKEEKRVLNPTFSGLAYYLDVCTETLRNYEDKDEFFGSIKKAKQRIEMVLERRLAHQAVTGTIFNLKVNFKWDDQVKPEDNRDKDNLSKALELLSDKLPG